jgi:hypothetical protein
MPITQARLIIENFFEISRKLMRKDKMDQEKMEFIINECK